MQKITAFTLAEVLVTLGIIGVVSAMTVPSLMQNYQRQSYVTQLHKVYNELQQAAMSYKNEKNALNLVEAGLNSQAGANDLMTKYFKVIQSCDTTVNCFAPLSEYKRISGTSFTASVQSSNSYVIASGVSIRPLYGRDSNKLLNVLVDINGKKGPNILGRDLFMMCLYNNGMVDDYSTSAGSDAPLTEAQRTAQYNSDCVGTSSVYGCFGKILNDNWQMTY